MPRSHPAGTRHPAPRPRGVALPRRGLPPVPRPPARPPALVPAPPPPAAPAPAAPRRTARRRARPRKVTAFIGPSGCGKSTLLRVLNRMYDLYPNQRAEGEVLLDGENILSPRQDLNLLRAKVGMVFQKPTPFPMTIFDNIAFGILLYERVSRSELADRVEAALTRAALWTEVKDKLQANGLSLSGGQQQRL